MCGERQEDGRGIVPSKLAVAGKQFKVSGRASSLFANREGGACKHLLAVATHHPQTSGVAG